MEINNLVKKLEEEHQIMNDLFDKLDKESDLENKKILTRKLQEINISHFKEEDEELYPILEKSKDEESQRMGKIFSVTMKGYADDFIIASEKILATTGDISLTLETEYKKTCDRIRDRISIEEVTIFPEYEKAVKNNG